MTCISVDTSAPSPSSNRWILILDVTVYLALLLAACLVGERTVAWVTGLSISLVGFAFWLVARRQLGNSFMIGVAAKGLVTHGLYRRFRHPIYLFGGLAHFGAFVALQYWWILAAWLIYSTAIQWTRLRKEDVALEARFGNEFREYRKVTWI